MHTYTVHVQVEASSDRDALDLADKIDDVLHHAGIPQHDVTYVTDADDWAENVGGEKCGCGKPVADRTRRGDGHRTCIEHATYPIQDIWQ